LKNRKEQEFRHLVDRPMKSGKLLLALSKCGLHLLPVEKDTINQNIIEKNEKT